MNRAKPTGARSVRRSELTGTATFRTSTACDTGACVGVAFQEDGNILVQNTTTRAHEPLTFTRREWAAFVAGVKAGEFDV
jgi:uncharacterized protein DUF397